MLLTRQAIQFHKILDKMTKNHESGGNIKPMIHKFQTILIHFISGTDPKKHSKETLDEIDYIIFNQYCHSIKLTEINE